MAIEVRPAELAAALVHEVGARPPVTLLGIGYDSMAFEDADSMVYRLPRVIASANRLRVEARLLPELAPLLPVAIPVPEFLDPLPSFQWGLSRHRKVIGDPFVSQAAPELKDDLLEFVLALQSFPRSRALELGLTTNDENVADMYANVLPVLKAQLTQAEYDKMIRWKNAFPSAVRLGEAVVVHGDLHPEHMLLDERGRLAGVIDFGDTRLDDPAIDLAGLILEPQEPMGRALIAAYESATGLDVTTRTERFAERALFWAIESAAAHPGEPGYLSLAESLELLRRSPILSR